MLDFGRYRYNMFSEGSDWFGGAFATDENIAKVDSSRAPVGIPIQEMLREAHRAFFVNKSK
jgi:predicted aldo/keto reductase-like oxidoreductase